MPRSGPRAVRKYSDEFKLTAVRLGKVHHPYARHPDRPWTATATQQNQIWVGDVT